MRTGSCIDGLRHESREFLSKATRRRYSDGAAPVKIHVSQFESQSLQFRSIEINVVRNDAVASGRYGALFHALGDYEKIVFQGVRDNVVDHRSRGWIIPIQKQSRVQAFRYYYERHFNEVRIAV